jgi:VWFA-related protein
MKSSALMTFTIGLLLFLLFAASDSVRAQQPDSLKNPLTINTDLVVTWAQVLDRKDGTVVKGLEIDDFVLREDGKPQQISLIKEDQPLSVVILVKGGYCGKWHPRWGFRRSAEALRQLGGDAEVALMGWEGDVVLTQPLTKDHKAIADQLEDRTFFLNAIARKQPQFFPSGDRHLPRPGEAVYQAARYLERTASPGRRKVIIALTYPDWTNETHLHTAAEVQEMLEKTGTTVYGLYQQGDGFTSTSSLSSKLGISGRDKRRRAGGTIEEFAEQTGGSILKGAPEEGDDMLIQMASLIRSSYTIGYYPANSNFDGSFRRVRLELSPGGKAKTSLVNIKTRSGYRAFRPSPIIAADIPPDAATQARQKEVQPYSVVILVQGLNHCCHEPIQLFTELSIQENRKALRLLGDDAEIALMAWDYDTALVQPMTRDQDLIAHRLKDKNAWINALRPRVYHPDGSAEFARPGEAVYRAAQYLEKNAASGRRKVIIVISWFSGVDEFQPRTAAEVKEILKKTGTAVYGLYEDYSPEDHAKYQRRIQKDKKERSGGTIEEFADQTGGTIFVGKPEESDRLLIKLTGLIRSGQPSPLRSIGVSNAGQKSSSIH